MKINHISIPHDQLELFKSEQKYQHYLIETLIYSTIATLHRENKTYRSIIAMTKHRIWVERQGKKPFAIELNQVNNVIKCSQHPQLVINTTQNIDNYRFSFNSESRCKDALSALSYYFKFISKKRKSLLLYSIQQNNLLYFERTAQEKKNTPEINLQRYKKYQISYEEPELSPKVYGQLLISKLMLSKQIYSEKNHMIHIARVNEKEYYFCHTVEINQENQKILHQHENIDWIEQLIYARRLQHKIQIFFEFLPSLKRQNRPVSDLFQSIYHLYDSMKMYCPNNVLTLNMLCYSQTTKNIKLREFRYQYLQIDAEINNYLYNKYQQSYLTNKMYNLGLVLYHYIFGRSLFEHEDIEVSIEIKENIEFVPFPLYLNAQMSKKLKKFIQSCILCKFQTLQMIENDPWIVQHSINLKK